MAIETNILPKESPLGTYGLGAIHYSSELSFLTSDGFILDKKSRLIQKPGYVFTKSANGDFSYYLYDFDPTMKSMAFYLVGGFGKDYETNPKQTDASFLRYLMKSAGGIDRLNKESCVYLPQDEVEQIPSSVQSAELLPYLYHLRDNSLSSEVDKSLLDLAIAKVESILLEYHYPIVGAIVEKNIKEKIDGDFTEALKKTDSTESLLVEQETRKLFPSDTKPKMKVWKKKRKKVIEKLSEERKKDIKQKAKLSILEKIRKIYLTKASEKKHFSSTDAKEFLGGLAKSFSTVGITRGESVETKGSHTGVELVTQEGGSFYLSLARRAQKDGYKNGTIKTIVNDSIDKAIKALVNS